jgi:hypothetical protein
MTREAVKTLATIAAVFGVQTLAFGAISGDTFDFYPLEAPMTVSDGASTNKVKILRTPDGTLFAIYGEAQDVSMLDGNSLVWDAKGSETRKPYDIVIKWSTDNGDTWQGPMNIDNTAALTSSKGILIPAGQPMTDPETGAPIIEDDPNAVDYPGDSDKPNVFNVGNNILVTWNGKYCPDEDQRYVVYPELYGIAVPYSCQYAARLVWNSTAKVFNTYAAWSDLPYKTERLSTGIRDAKQDANRGSGYGFVVNWQEDPLGLKLGEADGPGDGASGANVNNGTDIWYSYLDVASTVIPPTVDPVKFVNNAWSTASRITKNTFGDPQPLSGSAVGTHPYGDYDNGRVGASRPNIGQIDGNVIIAYEETKGTQGFEDGKYTRYHAFDYKEPPVGGEHGCIISNPWENSRRVRFLTQSASGNDVPLVFIYKEGDFTGGGPSDIMLRRAVGGFMPENLQPGIDVANCRASVMEEQDPLFELDFQYHLPAMNFSGTTEIGGVTGTAGLFDVIDTGANPIENSLAHRGMMRGNLLLIGYSYVPDLYQFLYLNDRTPYNFYVRRSVDGGATWTQAVNLTPEVTGESGLTVKEPRIVPTPASGPRCATDPTDCNDPNVIYAGYGLQENVYSHYESAGDVDIYMMITRDGGQTFSPAQAITAGDVLGTVPEDAMEDFETQIKLRPDGLESHTVWSGNDGEVNNALYRRGLVKTDVLDLPAAPSDLRVTRIAATSVDLAWTDNAMNEGGFYLERSMDGVNWVVAATLQANTTSYRDKGLTRATTYQYRVQAYNADGVSDYSNIAVVQTR